MNFLIPIRCINIRFINLGRSYPLATPLLSPYYPLTKKVFFCYLFV